MNKLNISVTESRRRSRAIIVMLTLTILVIAAFIVSMNTGHIRLSPIDVVKTLFGWGTDKQHLILFEFRLPRIIISVLIGAGFAVSGAILQGLFRNPLADPGLLGINAGAGLMVTLYIAFLRDNSSANLFLLPLLALGGAASAAVLIFMLAYKRHKGLLPTRMILIGVAVQAGINAAMVVLTLALDPEDYQYVSIWLAGSIAGSNWKYVIALVPWIFVLIPFAMIKSRSLNILNLGDQMAKGLGTPINRDRIWLLAAAVGLAGSCVAIGGGISFVGLVGPHLARRLVGPQHQLNIPTSALLGALLVIVADTIARSFSSLPTGIIVAIIGAPYFLYLLSKTK
ncbi:FecCD family ABC transporter permease [Paenibacillus gorillae]|uniref:FecCD family ABC transporter permease n=1 Tax=Paenibacillus gorillae TaxID=1243662 RepID=UPI0004AD57F2|nr:iron ABC transporter permease [Paenibacillus gorillae]